MKRVVLAVLSAFLVSGAQAEELKFGAMPLGSIWYVFAASFAKHITPALPAGWKLISSNSSWPTSAMNRSPVSRSKLKRQGLRAPYAQISGRAPSTPTNGLSGGIAYGEPPSTSMRRILPSSVPRFWALFWGSPADPPSPSPRYR